MQMAHKAAFGLASLALLGLACSAPAHAGNFGFFSTGVDAAGQSLPDGTGGDLHYTLISTPAGSTTDLLVRTSAGGFPIPPYGIPDSTTSAWIGPNNDIQLDGPAGDYDYRTTFDLTGINLATASVTGDWATDNEGTDILINGISTGNTTTDQYFSYTGFSITSGFKSGVNTVDFLVHNDGDPTALRVDNIQVSASPVPEASTTVSLGLLLCLGLGGLAWSARRRRVPSAE